MSLCGYMHACPSLCLWGSQKGIKILFYLFPLTPLRQGLSLTGTLSWQSVTTVFSSVSASSNAGVTSTPQTCYLIICLLGSPCLNHKHSFYYKNYSLFIFYLCICVWTYIKVHQKLAAVHRGQKRHQISWNQSYRWLWTTSYEFWETYKSSKCS